MLRWRCLYGDTVKDTVKDFLFVVGFASIFIFVGTVILFVFSVGSQIECDRWTDTCTLEYQYALSDSESFTWALSETSKVFLSTSYPKGTPEEIQNQKPTHRAVISLNSGEVMPWSPTFSSDKEVHEHFVETFSDYVSNPSLTAGDNGKFVRKLNAGWVLWVSVLLYTVGICIAVWGWWLSRPKNIPATVQDV